MKIREGHLVVERHVQAIWYDRDLRPPRMLAHTGESVRVVHPGEWNLSSGPDFIGAVLEIGEDPRRVTGDVEVHLAPGDWDAHGHGLDAAYRRVIAHVTWRDGIPPSSLPNGAVSICLGRYFSCSGAFSPECIDLRSYPFHKLPADNRPCHVRMTRDPDYIESVLLCAGDRRLREKADRIRGMLKVGEECQVFYSEVMRAFGYGKNVAGFGVVASAVPYAAVKAEPQNAESAFLAAATFADWERDRVRPNNSPERRLRSAAHLFAETEVMALACADDFSKVSCRNMLSVLTAGGHVGRGRAAAIVANVVLPFALAREAVRILPNWLPPEDVSDPVRRVACRIFGCDHNPRVWYAANGLLIQGLIHIGRRFCEGLHPGCGDCRVATGRRILV